MKHWWAWVLLGLLLGSCEKSDSRFHASEAGDQYAQADFHLTDHRGQPRSLADFRGKAVVLFFGYTHCPEVCPTKLADLAQTMRLLGPEAARVQVLFITLDPERDTREILAQYVPAFNPSFVALYGDLQATAEAARNFRVDYRKNPSKSSYTLDHTTFSYLIDVNGRVRLMAGERESAEWLAQDIRLLLASGH